MENEFKKPFNERKPIIRNAIDMQKYYNDEKEAIKKFKNYFKNNKEYLAETSNNINNEQTNNLNNSNNNIPSTSASSSKSNSSKSFYPEYLYFSSSIPEISQVPYDIGTKIIPANEFNMEDIKE